MGQHHAGCPVFSKGVRTQPARSTRPRLEVPPTGYTASALSPHRPLAPATIELFTTVSHGSRSHLDSRTMSS
jgi:hypothetical protein